MMSSKQIRFLMAILASQYGWEPEGEAGDVLHILALQLRVSDLREKAIREMKP